MIAPRLHRLVRAVATGTRRGVLQAAAGAILAGAPGMLNLDAAGAVTSCKGCRRCGQKCCRAGTVCRGRRCVKPCSTATCGRFPTSCSLFPADNIWRTPIDTLPTHAKSVDYVDSIGPDTGLHPDFGSIFQGKPIGIPVASVHGSQKRVKIRFTEFGDESDPGPYPIPLDAPIEGGPCGGSDRHVLVVDEETCVLYELYDARPRRDGGWNAGSGAIFDLNSNALRQNGDTSADAAGLPILPGLVRFEEVQAGVIEHALRFTAEPTQGAFVWPARHEASADTNPKLPPLGQRFRLKADFDVDSFSSENKTILTALKTYGMFLADNGGDWFLSGVPDPRWDNDELHKLQTGVHGRDFDAVDCSSLMVDEDSGQVA
jgi:hypothetical protein